MEPERRALLETERRYVPPLRRSLTAVLEALRDSERDERAWLAFGIDLDRALRPILAAVFQGGRKVHKARVGPRPGAIPLGPRPGALPRLLNVRIAELVTNVTEETRAAIRAIVARGEREGWTIARQAKALREIVGLNEPQAVAIQNLRASLEARGLSPARVDTLVGQASQKALRYRAQMIARTETIRAANDGQRALWQRAVAEGSLEPDTRQVWVAAGDACPICRALDGRETRVGSPFTGSIVPRGPGKAALYTPTADGPPAHPNCRCALALA